MASGTVNLGGVIALSTLEALTFLVVGILSAVLLIFNIRRESNNNNYTTNNASKAAGLLRSSSTMLYLHVVVLCILSLLEILINFANVIYITIPFSVAVQFLFLSLVISMANRWFSINYERVLAPHEVSRFNKSFMGLRILALAVGVISLILTYIEVAAAPALFWVLFVVYLLRNSVIFIALLVLIFSLENKHANLSPLYYDPPMRKKVMVPVVAVIIISLISTLFTSFARLVILTTSSQATVSELLTNLDLAAFFLGVIPAIAVFIITMVCCWLTSSAEAAITGQPQVYGYSSTSSVPTTAAVIAVSPAIGAYNVQPQVFDNSNAGFRSYMSTNVGAPAVAEGGEEDAPFVSLGVNAPQGYQQQSYQQGYT